MGAESCTSTRMFSGIRVLTGHEAEMSKDHSLRRRPNHGEGLSLVALQPNTFLDPKMNNDNTGRDVVLLSKDEADQQGVEQDLPWVVIWADGSHQGFETHETALWRRHWWRKFNLITEEGLETAVVMGADPSLVGRHDVDGS